MTVAETIERLGSTITGMRVIGVNIGGEEAPREIEPERMQSWMHLAEAEALDITWRQITIYYRTARQGRKEAADDVPGGH